MTHPISFLTATLCLLSNFAFAQTPSTPSADVLSYVNRQFSGNLFRGGSVPRGMMMMQVRRAPFKHFGLTTCGFSGASMPVGYEDVHLVAVSGGADHLWDVVDGKTNEPLWDKVPYTSTPGYHQRPSPQSKVTIETTATTRVGLARFTYEDPAQGSVFFFPRSTKEASIQVIGNNRITGQTPMRDYTLYFDLRFDRPFKSWGVINSKTRERTPQGTKTTRIDDPFYFEFDLGEKPVVQARISKSYVKLENATAAMEKECPQLDFEVVKREAEGVWRKNLELIRVEGHEDLKKQFYTYWSHCLYHPNTFSDINGDYAAQQTPTGTVTRNAGKRTQYTSISGWDIYRSWVQLHALILPDETSDLMQSMVNQSQQRNGRLPIWWVANFESGIMGGQSGVAIISNGYQWGAKNFDTAEAIKAVDTSLFTGEFKKIQSTGYLPTQGSPNMEAATMFFSASRFTNALGDKERAAKYLALSSNWEQLLHPATGLIQPKDEGGKFIDDYLKWDQHAFVEGTQNIYTLMNAFNVSKLIALLGGREKFIERLDISLQNLQGRGHKTRVPLPGPPGLHIEVSNEPSFSIPWLYAWVGQPAKIQDVARRSISGIFATRMAGDDDLGSISSWRMFVMMGMYPAIVGEPGFVLHGSMFTRVEMPVGKDKKLLITAPGVSDSARYIQSVKVNGKNHASTWLPLEILNQPTNTIEYIMGDKPSAWGTRPEDAPPSFSMDSAALKK